MLKHPYGTPSQLDRAVQIIEDLKNDGDPNTRVHLVTITMGANDIFPVLQAQTCFAAPQGGACQTQLDAVIAAYEENMGRAMTRLREAVEPGTVILAEPDTEGEPPGGISDEVVGEPAG